MSKTVSFTTGELSIAKLPYTSIPGFLPGQNCHMKFWNYYKFNYSILFATQTFVRLSFSLHISFNGSAMLRSQAAGIGYKFVQICLVASMQEVGSTYLSLENPVILCWIRWKSKLKRLLSFNWDKPATFSHTAATPVIQDLDRQIQP